MREVKVKTKKGISVVYETDLMVPENCTELGLGMWCCSNLTKKGELIFEDGVAQFINKDDALKFENYLTLLK